MADELNDEQIAEFREAFDLFDKGGTGAVPIDQLGTVLRCLGQGEIPTTEEIEAVVDDIRRRSGFGRGGGGGRDVDFPEFLAFVLKTGKGGGDDDGHPEGERSEAVGASGQDGTRAATVDEVRRISKELGMNLTDEEPEDMSCRPSHEHEEIPPPALRGYGDGSY